MLILKNQLKFLWAALGLLAVSAVSIMILPLYGLSVNSPVIIPLFAGTLLLWIGLIGGYTLLALFYRKNKNVKKEGKIGVISFFRNPYGAAADVVLIMSVALTIVLGILVRDGEWLFSVLFGLVFISANCHCVCNGRVFNTIIQKNKERGK